LDKLSMWFNNDNSNGGYTLYSFMKVGWNDGKGDY